MRRQSFEPAEELGRKERENFPARIVFTGLFLATMWLTTAVHGGKRIDSLSYCLDDLSYDFTGGINNYFLNNLVARDWMIMFNTWWFDISIFGLLFLYKADKLPSISFLLALFLAHGTKTLTQQFLMTLGRRPGYNFYFPGFYSVIVPYHDI